MTQQNDHDAFDFDWKMDVEPLGLYKPEAPNFTRLFILHRILKNFAKKNEKLLSLFKNCKLNNNHNVKVDKIVSSLIKYGIKSYMKDHYNENDDSQTIDLIFDDIISKYFDKEYHQITKYVDKSNLSLEYCEKVFNTNDLMCLIFQFVFDNIIDICLVCSQWLYYSFDKKSHIFNCNLPFALLIKISKFNPKNEAAHQLERYKSQLQRLYNVQSLNIHLPTDFVVTSKFLSYLAVLNNVEQLEILLGGVIERNMMTDRLKAVKVIIQQCGNQIKMLKISPGYISTHQSPVKLPVLRLNNVESMTMLEECFPIIFLNKLKSLTIGHKEKVTYLNHEWMKLVIDNCNCTNIKHLKIHNAWFNFSNININENTKLQDLDKTINAIKQFGAKFISLQKIDFVFEKWNYLSFNFWNVFIKSLKSILLKNQTLITSDTLINNQLQNINATNNMNIVCNKTRLSDYKITTLGKLLSNIFDDLQSRANDEKKYKVTYDKYDFTKWNITIYGPQDTPYENGLFDFGFEFSGWFPLHPPTIQMKTKIYHPNVSSEGKVRFSLYNNLHWRKDNGIRQILYGLVHLLREPDANNIENKYAWKLYKNDKNRFDETARRITKHFAIPE